MVLRATTRELLGLFPLPRSGISCSSLSVALSYQVCVTNAAMLSLTKTVNIFPLEKTLIDRERAAHSFHALPYLLGKVLAELPVVSLPPLVFGSILYPMVGLEAGFKRYDRRTGTLTASNKAFCHACLIHVQKYLSKPCLNVFPLLT